MDWTANLPCIDDCPMDTKSFFLLFTTLQPSPEFAGVAPVLQNRIQGEKCLATLKSRSPVAPPCVVSSRNGCSCKAQASEAGSQSWPWGARTALSRGPAGRERQNHPNTSMSTPMASPRPCFHPPEQTCTPCRPCPCRAGGGGSALERCSLHGWLTAAVMVSGASVHFVTPEARGSTPSCIYIFCTQQMQKKTE